MQAAAKKAKDVVEGAAEFVQEMTAMDTTEAEEAEGEADGESEKDNGAKPMTMEERKKKLEQLRKRMVSHISDYGSPFHSALSSQACGPVLPNSMIPRGKIVPQSSTNLPS